MTLASTLRFLALFGLLTLTTSLAWANSCVKVRNGESYDCMKFSAAEKRAAAKYRLQLAAPFEANKHTLIQQGWVLDKRWLSDKTSEPFDGREMICGSGWDAVCQTAFRKNEVVLVLTLSGGTEGAPLVAAEVVKRDPEAVDFDRTLVTNSFIIRIKLNCAEGNVSCDDVTYVGTS